ncbi:MAG TPA: hypothetical protein VNG53_09335 [Bacteroidia bacterium]|nr:hypothetical protein [Bacteroidia bacterium]
MENKEDELNRIRIENEIKKMKLSLEHGASFFSPSEKKLSPEQEGEWLNQVQKFEDSYTKSKRIVIYDFIEKPTYKPVNEIPEAKIKYVGTINVTIKYGTSTDGRPATYNVGKSDGTVDVPTTTISQRSNGTSKTTFVVTAGQTIFNNKTVNGGKTELSIIGYKTVRKRVLVSDGGSKK